MPNQIIPVQWGKPLRKSEVNTLDKVNELIDFINNSSIHELDLIASDAGREIVTGTSTQLARLEVYGESVQGGTPTPDNPVPVQVVGGRNLIPYPYAASSGTYSGVTATINEDGRISLSGTATANVYLNLIAQESAITLGAGSYTLSAVGLTDSINMTLGHIVGGSGQYLTAVTAAAPTRTITFTDTEQIFGYVYIPSGETVNTTLAIQLEAGTHATPYTPYGCIGLQSGETVTPIDLQGHTLASTPSGRMGILNIDGVGIVEITSKTQRSTIVSVGTMAGTGNQRYASLTPATPLTNWASYADMIADTRNETMFAYCTKCGHAEGALNVQKTWNSLYAYAPAEIATQELFNSLIGAEFVVPSPTQTIELGTITPPTIPSGSVVKINATLQPEFALTWFTENGLPLVIDDMRDYVDAKINEVNARIDELHGITRASLEVQSIPVDDLENENTENDETEVTENER